MKQLIKLMEVDCERISVVPGQWIEYELSLSDNSAVAVRVQVSQCSKLLTADILAAEAVKLLPVIPGASIVVSENCYNAAEFPYQIDVLFDPKVNLKA